MAVKRYNGSAWEVYAGASAADPTRISNTLIQAAGDLIIGSGFQTATRLGLGASGLGLVSNGTTAAWGAPTPAAHVASHAGNAADEFKGRLIINAQVSTSYTIAPSDEGVQRLLTLNNALPITVTVPTAAQLTFAVGSQIAIAQLGAGQVTLQGTGIIATPGSKLRTTGSTAVLINLGTNSWLLVGDTSA